MLLFNYFLLLSNNKSENLKTFSVCEPERGEIWLFYYILLIIQEFNYFMGVNEFDD